jgi:uroporphyrinogen decarboxylase
MKLPLEKPSPNITWFKDVIQGRLEPQRPPLVELFLDQEILSSIAQDWMGIDWLSLAEDRDLRKAYWDRYIEVHYRLGYDYIRMTGGMFFEFATDATEDTADLSRGNRSWYSSHTALISDWDTFEKYPWPSPSEDDLWDYEYVATHLPEGMGLFVCPTSGFLEIPMDGLFGYENLSYLIYDQPDLVDAVFTRTADLIHTFYLRLVGLPNLAGFFQGDDMGFKTSTLVSPNFLRRYVLPEHRKLADLAHNHGYLYLLHSCGNLSKIMEDLISVVKIDGKHSYEDAILPARDFKGLYGDRIAILGGIDIDKICRLPEAELRAYVRATIAACLPGGRFAIGSGNTVANYVPVQNYRIMLEESLNWKG